MSHQVRQFTEDDVLPALTLCRAAGWNQLEVDWHRLIDYQPDGCWVAEVDGRVVGTVTTTSYGTTLAWIGMMLVDPNYRRRGIASALIGASVDYLRGRGVRCIKLDATPEGKLVYQRLGFQTEWNFHRWQRDLARAGDWQRVPGLPSSAASLAAASLDRQAFGVDRLDWLARVADQAVVCDRKDGFGMIREGHLAHYLGPITAAQPQTAGRVIEDLLSRTGGRVFWDVPQPNSHAVRLAEQLGFVPVRDLERMWLGAEMSPQPQVDLQYALCDPGTG